MRMNVDIDGLCRYALTGTIMFILISAITQSVFAIDPQFSVFTPGSKPYGMSFEEWTEKWWTWHKSMPRATNPAADQSGQYCAQGQSGPVWFLAGNFGGKTIRSCNIPTGKAIFVPLGISECSHPEYPNLKTEQELRGCGTSFENALSVSAVVDGVALQKNQIARITTPLFTFALPPDNTMGLPAGKIAGAASGDILFLKPLPPGPHEISFKAITQNVDVTSSNYFSLDVTYHLSVR